jgi:DNA-binding HxlR family transcriptional regulator
MGTVEATSVSSADEKVVCCTVYQEAVELIGRRWTGAIVSVLIERDMRYGDIAAAVPDLSDRLLATRLRELEEKGMITKAPCSARQSSHTYGLTDMGRDLGPAIDALGIWAQRWLACQSS